MTDKRRLLDLLALRTNIVGALIVAGLTWAAAKIPSAVSPAASKLWDWLGHPMAAPRGVWVGALVIAVAQFARYLLKSGSKPELPPSTTALPRKEVPEPSLVFPPMPTTDEPLTDVQWKIIYLLGQGRKAWTAFDISHRLSCNEYRAAAEADELVARNFLTQNRLLGDRPYTLGPRGRKLLLDSNTI